MVTANSRKRLCNWNHRNCCEKRGSVLVGWELTGVRKDQKLKYKEEFQKALRSKWPWQGGPKSLMDGAGQHRMKTNARAAGEIRGTHAIQLCKGSRLQYNPLGISARSHEPSDKVQTSERPQSPDHSPGRIGYPRSRISCSPDPEKLHIPYHLPWITTLASVMFTRVSFYQ